MVVRPERPTTRGWLHRHYPIFAMSYRCRNEYGKSTRSGMYSGVLPEERPTMKVMEGNLLGPSLVFNCRDAMTSAQFAMDPWFTAVENWSIRVMHVRGTTKQFCAQLCYYKDDCRCSNCNYAHPRDFVQDEPYLTDKGRPVPDGWYTYIKVDLGPLTQHFGALAYVLGCFSSEPPPCLPGHEVQAYITFWDFHATVAKMPITQLIEGERVLLNCENAFRIWKSTQHGPMCRVTDPFFRDELFFQKTLHCHPKDAAGVVIPGAEVWKPKVTDIDPGEVSQILKEFRVDHPNSHKVDIPYLDVGKMVKGTHSTFGDHKKRTKILAADSTLDRALDIGLSPILFLDVDGCVDVQSGIYDLVQWLAGIVRSSGRWVAQKNTSYKTNDDCVHVTYRDIHLDESTGIDLVPVYRFAVAE